MKIFIEKKNLFVWHLNEQRIFQRSLKISKDKCFDKVDYRLDSLKLNRSNWKTKDVKYLNINLIQKHFSL